ncbi:MAG: DEAD/DEAH box helicase family protein, partial [Nitratireductor sp.]
MTPGPDFPSVFEAVHGYRPYRWQERLAEEIDAAPIGQRNAGWPGAIAAPTGAGKTAVLDVAVWRLAMAAASEGRRSAPMRIVFAVDRRVVVDQAHARACLIAERLKSAMDGPLAEVRALLARFSGDEAAPLHVEQLRGGLPREDDWARSPAQPTILCTTVDQLGSRLLFRGYGISERMAPVHAGLLGEDALVFLDEAHLSAAFVETLSGVARWRSAREIDLGLPWGYSLLTATPREGLERFSLSASEREEHAIKQRLKARLQAVIVMVRSEDLGSVADAFVAHARRLAGGGGR